jgi:DNA-binding IscR family transcriptional regulator
MESRTERLIRAAGNREAFSALRALLGAEMTTNTLASATNLTPAMAERTLETLSQASLVSRKPGPQGAWYLTHWPETLAFFDAARVLGVAIQGSEDRSVEDERDLFSRLHEAGGPAEAAKRGRPASA